MLFRPAGANDRHPDVDRVRTGRERLGSTVRAWMTLSPLELAGYSMLVAGAVLASWLMFERSPIIDPGAVPAGHDRAAAVVGTAQSVAEPDLTTEGVAELGAVGVRPLAREWDRETGLPSSDSGFGVRSAPVTVHVTGAVRRPGLYQLGVGARVADAIRAAGGALPTADVVTINLARTVGDAEQVVVDYRAGHGGLANAGSLDELQGHDIASGGSANAGARLIDLNRAGVEQLITLPGIGPTRAAAIVEHRELHGPFRVPGDLRAVSGIGETTFQNLSDRVTVR